MEKNSIHTSFMKWGAEVEMKVNFEIGPDDTELVSAFVVAVNGQRIESNDDCVSHMTDEEKNEIIQFINDNPERYDVDHEDIKVGRADDLRDRQRDEKAERFSADQFSFNNIGEDDLPS